MNIRKSIIAFFIAMAIDIVTGIIEEIIGYNPDMFCSFLLGACAFSIPYTLFLLNTLFGKITESNKELDKAYIEYVKLHGGEEHAYAFYKAGYEQKEREINEEINKI